LESKAVVYLRQSSERQVRENKESQRLQYALADRARELGWKEVEIIDSDLASSATIGAPEREGFNRLIASVALGEVGIVFSLDLSRLLRTDKDWCQLAEVCQVFGALLSDGTQIYDLNLLDDQMILGFKGTLSVVEYRTMQMRLIEAMQKKAERGELLRLLPPGFVREEEAKVVKDPDERVREAMDLLFRKFREIRSIRQTFLWFHENGVELPVNKRRGDEWRLVWQLPTLGFVRNALRNAFYAGAYVWGQRPTEMKLVDGRLLKRSGSPRRPEECKVFIREHHEGYIDWETFEENRRMIRGNSLDPEGDERVTAVRKGQGHLVGLLRCGRCGRKLHVRYWGKSGTAARYLCGGDFALGGKYCLAFGGARVDRRFSKELLRVLSPLGMRASLEAMKRIGSRNQEERQALLLQLQQLEYEARRASEQYNEVDPRNRLVASELERRWNAKLEELESLRSRVTELDREVRSLTEKEREEILALGERFSSVWESEHCPVELKKKIMRTVVEEVIVDLDDATQMLRLVIHWKGGTHTQFEMEKPKAGSGRKTSKEDLEVIRGMAVRYGDDEIARVLNKLGRRTATGKRWNEERVGSMRKKYSIEGQRRRKPDPEVLTQAQAAKHCGVSVTTIKRLVASGVLKKEQVAPWAPWEIQRSDLDSEPVRTIVAKLRETGRLELGGNDSTKQLTFFQ
jgi:DNA invertase Pin-like site-specific DNA recombinase